MSKNGYYHGREYSGIESNTDRDCSQNKKNKKKKLEKTLDKNVTILLKNNDSNKGPQH